VRISDLDVSGQVKWIICRWCKKKFLMRGGSKHVRMCAKRKKAEEDKDRVICAECGGLDGDHDKDCSNEDE